MHKKVLSEESIYHGKVKMPKGFEIDHESILVNITGSNVYDIPFPNTNIFSELNTYLIENIYLNFNITLSNVKTWGDIIYPTKKSEINITFENFKHHFVLVYGVKIEPRSTYIKIYFNNKPLTFEIKEGEFVMFPSNLMYNFTENKSNKFNFIQTILYERF
tara:strand:- start:1629 stop:2111 length:483 start_codon:yes stop_codon:yes gene_type:complete